MRPLWGVSCLRLFADGQSRASTVTAQQLIALFCFVAESKALEDNLGFALVFRPKSRQFQSAETR